nr:hypothetical protein [Clostridia bacterium]
MTTKQNDAEKNMEEHRKARLVAEIRADFDGRREMRRQLERGWQLNMNFLSGNQHCDISPVSGELEEEESAYYWQSRKSFNHIAPTVDTRIARLAKVRPTLTVRAFSDTDEDVKTARLCSNIIKSVKNRLDFDKIVARATLWSETCGTAFYKVVWNFNDGKVIGADETGHSVHEGDVNIVALSPFEIYPDSLTAESMEEVQSIIHAKAVPVSEIFDRFGVKIAGRSIGEFSLAPYSSPSDWKTPQDGNFRPAAKNAEILIERYTRPNGEFPNG